MDIQIGKRYKVIDDYKKGACGATCDIEDTAFVEITKINDSGCLYYTGYDSDGNSYGNCYSCIEKEHLELITNINTMTDLTEKFALTFIKEPQKTFRKAGITNGDNMLTDEGMKIFLTWMLGKHEDEFKKEVVDELVKEDK